MRHNASWWRRPRVIGPVAVVPAALLGFGAYWFEPWKLFTNQSVDEALPGASAGPRTLAQGSLISHEHATKGTVKLLQLADGSRVLRLEDLDTSNGPALRVWLSDQPVEEGIDGWRVFDDGKYVNLGELKGNKGDQNHPVPAGVDLAGFSSVSIWCDRFDVSFGAAELAARA
ncbi:DM13 domain-containing protein [Streptomyces sp. NPDC090022]|uniref:DM13 domain-containing protein n=1 Tax=Streptomyces sp. NPDC090022 TaxID=3365920 RepID=UPI00381FC3A1